MRSSPTRPTTPHPIPPRRALAHAAALLAVLPLAFSLSSCGDDDAPAPATAAEGVAPALPSYRPTADLRLPETRVDWIAIGGGAEPTSSQVSLEQDLALAREVLGPSRGVVLHAGGRGGASVMESADAELLGDTFVERLGALFDPRESRASTYRESAIEPAGPSTYEALDAALTLALLAPEGSPPLVLYVNGHGEPGELPRESLVRLWGGFPLIAEDLALRLDDAARPTRVVVTACYSGGFDALAFRNGDPNEGAAPGDRCGLFATTPDRLASGCDPNPDRAAQESFALHFLHALAGEDARGRPLPASEIDFDADGLITLYEAHARARIAARSIDVPTTTSERWLREKADGGPLAAPRASSRDTWPTEAVVVERLGRVLELADEAAARARLAELEAEAESLDAELDEAEAVLDEAWAKLRILLLTRWPILDDAFDPRFLPTVARDRGEIEHLLDTAPEALAYAGAQSSVDALTRAVDASDETIARVTRLVRAHENIALLTLLRRAGGPDVEVFEKLRACEATAVAPAPGGATRSGSR
jgi:hypothetical protein